MSATSINSESFIPPLSNSHLKQLLHNHQKFVGTISRFNNQAKKKILLDFPKEALLQLNEAQRVLEYAASCGKNIDRNMIVNVLHNQACCYQKLWELQKCSNYLQALIFNVSSHLKTNTPSPRQAQDYIKTSGSLSSHLRDSLFGKPIIQRIQLSKYHLQFCAINSQLRNHKGALISGKRAIALIKDIFQEMHAVSIEKSTIQNNYTPAEQQEHDYQTKLHLIAGLGTINDEPNIGRLDDYISTARYYFRKWNIRKLEQKNEKLKQLLKNFSIGHVMQIKPVGCPQNSAQSEPVVTSISSEKLQRDVLQTEKLPKVIEHALLLTVGYFTIATELRLISAEKYRNCEEKQKKSNEYIESQIYHIIALIITSIYVPYDMIYMRHLFTSFSNHYQGHLNEWEAHDQDENKIMSKQFDPCSFCEGKTAKTIKKQKSMNMNRSLAIQFTDSIRITDQTKGMQRLKRDHIEEIKEFKKSRKNKSDSKSRTKKSKEKKMKANNQHQYRYRGNSLELMKIEEFPQIGKSGEALKKSKNKYKKSKVKSTSQKTRKSTSNQNSTKKKSKREQTTEKHKEEYYRFKRTMNKSKSPRSTAQKNSFKCRQGWMDRSSTNDLQKTFKSSKGLVKSGNSESVRTGKKEQVKKKLDKYYF